MGKIKIDFDFLNKYNQVQLRVYKPNGKYLTPIKNWYHIGDQWGLKIKSGQFKMSNVLPFIKTLNAKLDSLDADKTPYEMMFFNGTTRYDEIHNIPTDGWDCNYEKIIGRKFIRKRN